jgi:hypothetical protein
MKASLPPRIPRPLLATFCLASAVWIFFRITMPTIRSPSRRR